MHAVAGVFRRQRTGVVVKDGVAVDVEDRLVVSKFLYLRVARVDGRIFEECCIRLFLRRVEDGLQENDGVGL